MANIIIRSDERNAQAEQTLKDYGIEPRRATKEQRDMADCVAQKTNEAIDSMRRR